MILELLFVSVTMQFNLPPGLLSTVCYVESNHNTAAFHESDGVGNSVGICQIKHSTAKWLGFKGTEQELFEPYNNIYYSGKFLSYQINRYNNVAKGIIAYNVGNAKNLTRTKYSDKVLNKWRRVNVCSKQ